MYDRLSAVEPDIANLSPFQHPIFIDTWIAASKSAGLSVIEINRPHEENEVCCSRIRLCRKRMAGLQISTVIGSEVSDYGLPWMGTKSPLLSSKPDSYAQELKESSRGSDVIHLPRLHGLEVDRIRGLFPTAMTIESDSTWSLSLADSFEASCSHLSSKRLADTRRKRRKLEKLGDFQTELIKSQEEMDRVIDWILEVKKELYGSRYDRKTQEGMRLSLFYKGLASADSSRIRFLVHAAKLDDLILSAHLGIQWRNSFVWVLPATSKGPFSYLSPGRVLMEALIKEAVDSGLGQFDFSRGFHQYKFEWATKREPLFDVLIPLRKRGKVYCLAHQHFYGVKSFKHFLEGREQGVKHEVACK